jgi:hypothetical protein
VVLLLCLTALSCPVPDPVLENDAGDDAFAQRAMWLMWGRKPTSMAERAAIVHMIEATDRPSVVREMARTPDYVDRWQEFLYDALAVNRNGDRSNSLCYRIGYWDDDAALAAFVAAAPASQTDIGTWTLRDLTRSALLYDDVSPLFRANLFPNAAMPGVPPNLIEAEADRRDFATVFFSTHLGRTPDCLPCHNSEGSVTDAEDPETDRFWPLPGTPERDVFGDPEGRDLDSLGIFFRRHGVSHGFLVDGFGFEPFPPIDLEGDPIPEGFDGCAPLENAPEAGCGSCICENRVCNIDAECCEEQWDEFCAAMCVDTLDGECSYHLEEGSTDPFQPWNMHDGCGSFTQPAWLRPDISDGDGWFGESLGATSSAYALEDALRSGFDQLRTEGMSGGGDGATAGARLIAARLADRVWAEAFGRPLTISHGFPRNAPQRDRLLALSDVFVDGGFSMVDMLVAVTSDPLFNQPLPREADAEHTYYYPPVIDPWSIEAEDPDQRGNGLGDLVHRPDPRMLIRAARAAMQWRDTEGFPITTNSFHGGFQTRLGAYITWSEPGFEGVDFQWLSAWEARFEECLEPAWDLRGDGCEPNLDQIGCPDCDCFAGVCQERRECCLGPWDAACAESCRRFNACPVDESRGPDWIDALVTESTSSGATWEATIAALKDRILSEPSVTDVDERAVLEDLIGASLSDEVESPEASLRAICGALLTSPQFLLTGLPLPEAETATFPMPGETTSERCTDLTTWMFTPAICP